MPGWDVLAGRYQAIASRPLTIAQPVAKAFDEKLADEYAKGADPYSKQWAPLKRKGAPRSYLTETGEMKASSHVTASSETLIVLKVDDPRASFHQYGTSIMVARKMAPDESALPPDWQKAITDEFRRSLSSALGR